MEILKYPYTTSEYGPDQIEHAALEHLYTSSQAESHVAFARWLVSNPMQFGFYTSRYLWARQFYGEGKYKELAYFHILLVASTAGRVFSINTWEFNIKEFPTGIMPLSGENPKESNEDIWISPATELYIGEAIITPEEAVPLFTGKEKRVYGMTGKAGIIAAMDW